MAYPQPIVFSESQKWSTREAMKHLYIRNGVCISEKPLNENILEN